MCSFHAEQIAALNARMTLVIVQLLLRIYY